MTLSIVIPTWNEAIELPETLRRVQAIPEVREVWVVDGGSTDDTCDIARRMEVTLVPSMRGRARQMQVGLERCSGDVIVFVHADTWLPPDAGAAIGNALSQPRCVGGGFQKRFRDPPLLARGGRFRAACLFKLTGLLFGDQAIFIRRDVLEAVGGMPQVPIAEEFELCRKVSKRGQLVLLPQSVQTSSRLLRQQGVLRTWLSMVRVLVQYHRGVPLDQIAARYNTSLTK